MTIVLGKLGIARQITATGTLGEFDIDSTDSKIKFTTVNAGPTFKIEVLGRVEAQHTFTHIAYVTGPTDQTVDITLWDFLQINVTVYDSTSNHVDLNASGFTEDSGSLASITVPFGTDLASVSDLIFTSSDSSVTITGNSGTNTIDFVSAGGGVTTKYIKTVILGDWVGPSGGNYTLTIPFSTHAIANPVVVAYETNGATFDLIMVPINIDASNNIIITVPQTPDARFVGKVVIE